ncbi:hypothetical protein ACVWXO_007053 [Bradyrhizobium sp. LM2.7]
MSPSYRFGAFVEEGTYCTDPGAYVAAIVDAARMRGAVLRQARVTGLP